MATTAAVPRGGTQATPGNEREPWLVKHKPLAVHLAVTSHSSPHLHLEASKEPTVGYVGQEAVTWAAGTLSLHILSAHERHIAASIRRAGVSGQSHTLLSLSLLQSLT